MEEKINFLGIRKLYEKTGNQNSLDSFILDYIRNMPIEDIKLDPVIKGVKLSEAAASKVPVAAITILVEAEVEPRDILINKALQVGNREQIFKRALVLYDMGLIDVKGLEKTIVDSGDYTLDIITEFMLLDLEKYDGIDFRGLAMRYLGYKIKNYNVSKYLMVTMRFFHLVPYGTLTKELARKMVKAVELCKQENMTAELKSVDNFIKGLVSEKHGNELIEFLHNRPDYLLLLKYGRTMRLKDVLYDDEDNTLYTKIDELVQLAIKGELKRPAFTIFVFPSIYEERERIINGWVENEREVELDIFLKPLLNKTLEPHPGSILGLDYCTFDRYDNLYAKALEEQMTPQKEKTHIIKPVNDSVSN